MPAVPKPIPLKLIEGRGNGKDTAGREIPKAPNFVRLPPTPPRNLPKEAQNEWKRVVPELSRLELLKPVDRASLTAYCLTWARLMEAQEILNAEGLLHRNSQGVVRHPALAVVEAASKELRAWANEYGLTPAAENRIAKKGEGPKDEADPFE